MRITALRPAFALGLALASVVTLSACSPESEPKPDDTSASPSASTDAQPDASEAPATGSSPVGVDCEELITLAELYEFNPNVSPIADFSAEAGSDAAEAVAAQGVACGYVNQTSGETTVVSASKPGESALAELRTELAAATPAPELGAEAWFTTGTAHVIEGEYLVTAASEFFYTAADAQPLVAAALGHLS